MELARSCQWQSQRSFALAMPSWQSSKNQYSCCERASLKVTANIQCIGRLEPHHSRPASGPSSQVPTLSSTFGALAGGPPWLLSQRWVFHLQLDSEQIPTTRNGEGKKACISSPFIPSLSVCHKSTLSMLEWELQHALSSHFKPPLLHPPPSKYLTNVRNKPTGSKTSGS